MILGEIAHPMAKIQIELTDDEDRIVEIYKLVHRLRTKQEAIKQMVRHFESDVLPKRMSNKDYFSLR